MKGMGLKKNQQLIVAAGLVATVVLGYYHMLILKPMSKANTELGQQVRAASLKLQQMTRVVSQEASLRQQYEQVTGNLKSLHTALPPEEELPAVIELLSSIAGETGVKIQTIFPQKTFETQPTASANPTPKVDAGGSQLYKEMPIQIDGLAGFHQLGMFLSRMESGSQPVQLKSLRISNNPKDARRHIVKMVLLVYFSTGGLKSTPASLQTQGKPQ